MGKLISEKYAAWQAECEARFQQLKKNEEELNRIFIDIYGLQDELTPDVADKDVTVHRIFDSKDDVPESMKGSNYVRTMRDEIVSLISYAVGCMFGRYSIYKDGLIFAGEPYSLQAFVNKLNDQPGVVSEDELNRAYHSEGVVLSEMFYPDEDNIIPICDDEYFDDDITGRFVEFVRKVYGDDTLGKLLLSDDPEVQNPAQGLYWLERAAESGNNYAAYRLGKEYLSGKSAPKNPERAAEYVRMAAECGNPYAQYLLGKLCLSGDGVPQDKDAAYDWFQKAQAQGHDYAGFFVDRIERQEPPNVLLSATRLLYHMGKIFQSSAPAPQSGIQIDRKRLAKLRRMRMAAGHKADDHEQEQSSTMSMGW